MKTMTLFCFVCIIACSVSQATIVDSISAKIIATNFYNNNSDKMVTTLKLAFTNTAEDGSPAYYVFNINTNDGFVIISADDNALPVLGYSTTGNYDAHNMAPAAISWMADFNKQISFIKINNIKATQEISAKWQYYQNSHNSRIKSNSISVAPLLKTKWDQSPYYNALCPGGSVTGCVATSMSQIMKYWNYPAKGTGSYSYCNCIVNGFQKDYGILSANFDITTYNYSNMPDKVTTTNNDVATLMYHCGVSVDMNYSPNGSSAIFNSMVGALTKYFGYDPATISYKVRNTSDTTWLNDIKTELNNHRPIIYNLNGVHSWVCDGYDVNNYLHMNWGWGGRGDGYYALADTIHISNGYTMWGSKQAYNAIIGIQPLSNTTSILSSMSTANEIIIYPNPATNQINISALSFRTNEAVTISVTNVLGKMVQEERAKWSNDKSINIKTLPSGIYFIQVTNESGKWVGKFMKE